MVTVSTVQNKDLLDELEHTLRSAHHIIAYFNPNHLTAWAEDTLNGWRPACDDFAEQLAELKQVPKRTRYVNALAVALRLMDHTHRIADLAVEMSGSDQLRRDVLAAVAHLRDHLERGVDVDEDLAIQPRTQLLVATLERVPDSLVDDIYSLAGRVGAERALLAAPAAQDRSGAGRPKDAGGATQIGQQGPYAEGCFRYDTTHVTRIPTDRRWPLLKALWDHSSVSPRSPRPAEEVWRDIWGRKKYKRGTLRDVMKELNNQFAKEQRKSGGWVVRVEFTARGSADIYLVLTPPSSKTHAG